MNRHKYLNMKAHDAKTERVNRYYELDRDPFLEWVIEEQRFTRENAIQEWLRLDRLFHEAKKEFYRKAKLGIWVD